MRRPGKPRERHEEDNEEMEKTRVKTTKVMHVLLCMHACMLNGYMCLCGVMFRKGVPNGE